MNFFLQLFYYLEVMIEIKSLVHISVFKEHKQTRGSLTHAFSLKTPHVGIWISV